MPASLRSIAKRFQPAFLSMLLVLVVGTAGGPLLIFHENRSGESQENSPSERQEEFTTQGRFDHERHMKFEQRLLAITFEVPSSHLGHTQNAVFLAPTGHRLSNGLLAPLTC